MRGFRGYRRNEESPFRALTQFSSNFIKHIERRRNEESPFRALTQDMMLKGLPVHQQCRNEESPFRALTHSIDIKIPTAMITVEMKKARLGR